MPARTMETEQGAAPAEVSMFKAIRDKFIEGGAGFMSFVALCLILGLDYVLSVLYT